MPVFALDKSNSLEPQRERSLTSLRNDFSQNGLMNLGGQPQGAVALANMIIDFENSDYKKAIESIEGDSFTRSFSIDKSSIFRILSQEGCEGIRIYFAVVEGKLTLAFVGLEINQSEDGDTLIDDLIKVDKVTRHLIVAEGEEEVIKDSTTLLLKTILPPIS